MADQAPLGMYSWCIYIVGDLQRAIIYKMTRERASECLSAVNGTFIALRTSYQCAIPHASHKVSPPAP